MARNGTKGTNHRAVSGLRGIETSYLPCCMKINYQCAAAFPVGIGDRQQIYPSCSQARKGAQAGSLDAHPSALNRGGARVELS
jgi:hypothetical protein